MNKLDFFWSLRPDEEKWEEGKTAWLNDPSARGHKDAAIERIKRSEISLSADLTQLDLNKLFPEIGLLNHLVELTLGNIFKKNCLSSLPTEIGRLTNLWILNLHNNELSHLPTEIGRLKNLRRLDVGRNHFKSLPTEIAQLTLLENLDISDNPLSSIPSIFRLTSLCHLECDLLELTLLPTEIGRLTNLNSLYLSYNKLTSLPAEITLLTKLAKVYLKHNNLTSLPAQMGRLTELTLLTVVGNRNLSDLPMSLGDIPALSYIDSDDTAIPESITETILNQCRLSRDKAALALLPAQLAKWRVYGGSQAAINCADLTENQQGTLSEWLRRLELTAEFDASQNLLAKTVCAILEGLENPEFKTLFFNQAEANNACCQDRAAMSLNEIYTSWLVLCKASSPSILKGVAKTLRLRKTLQKLIQKHNPHERESVEIFLYYETRLREVLQLQTAIHRMRYASIGCRSWIDQNALIRDVQENFYEELIDLPLFSSDVNEEFYVQLENMGECPPGGDYDPQVLAYKARQGEIMAAWRERKIAQAKGIL